MRKDKIIKWGTAGMIAFLSIYAYTAEMDAGDVDQGWTDAQKKTWYTLSQGSRLLPLTWFQALEQPDNNDPFLLRSHTEKYRYLTDATANPTPLPVGFAVDVQDDRRFSEITRLRWKKNQSSREPWVGMNCAACHTNEITYHNVTVRIEGAPTLADFQGYMKSLDKALRATKENPEKFDRFAKRVLRQDDAPESRAMLTAALGKLVDWQTRVERANETDIEYGFGRLDAFGHIFNKILLRTEGAQQPFNPADAPVSYPFLWNIHQHKKVQWNGIAENKPLGNSLDIGALGRNVGEVIGVFADLTLLKPGPAFNGYPNSARVQNLLALEKQLSTLKPPKWPQAFPAINPDGWSAGKVLFEKHCWKCHQVLKRDDLKTSIRKEMSPLWGADAVETDPWMACNAYTYRANSGLLYSTPKNFFIGAGRKYGKTEDVADLLATAVIGSIYYRKDELAKYAVNVRSVLLMTDQFNLRKDEARPEQNDSALTLEIPPTLFQGKAERLQHCMDEKTSPLLAYKARPLTGIWATPPYLHNGSVASLYDLLLPPTQRPPVFDVGTREFDPQRVGFVTNASDPGYRSAKSSADNTFLYQTSVVGNSNGGHDYGNAQLTDAERWALVEYMKAVGAERVGNDIRQ